MARRNQAVFITILAMVSILPACTYNVAFNKPDQAAYGEKIPIDVAFGMSEKARNESYEGRAWSSGIANTWVVPVGDTTSQYAGAYLPGAFRKFIDLDSAAPTPPGFFLVRLEEINFRMEGQAAHTNIVAAVSNPSGKQVFRKNYPEDGPSGFGRVIAAGAFTQKSAIRQSTHVVLENTFRKLVEDIRAGYQEWLK